MSVGIAILLIAGFVALGSFGLGSQTATATGPDNNSDTQVGGNAGNTHFTTGTDVTGSLTITTREQSGPERVCVEHFVDGVLNNTDFLPINSDVVQDVLNAANHTRVRGNEWWQLCGATHTTTTTTHETTTTTHKTLDSHPDQHANEHAD